MHLPADAHGIVAHQRLLVEQRMQPDRSRQREQHDESHAGKLPALGLKEGLAVLRRQPVDDAAKETEHPHLGEGDRRHQHGIDEDVGPGAACIMHAEGDQRLRRLDRLGDGKRIEPLFKPAEHCRHSTVCALTRRGIDGQGLSAARHDGPAIRSHPHRRPCFAQYRVSRAFRRQARLAILTARWSQLALSRPAGTALRYGAPAKAGCDRARRARNRRPAACRDADAGASRHAPPTNRSRRSAAPRSPPCARAGFLNPVFYRDRT